MKRSYYLHKLASGSPDPRYGGTLSDGNVWGTYMVTTDADRDSLEIQARNREEAWQKVREERLHLRLRDD